MAQNLSKLETIIGYKFKDVSLLERALTHRSWAFEKLPAAEEEKVRELQNESLEFVGDSIVGMAIAEQLFRLHPTASEGELTLMKHHLVSTEMLAKLSKNLGLSKFIRLGRGEEKTGGRKRPAIQANTLEAVIAAIFFDSGYIQARAFVKRIFQEELRRVSPRSSLDYKTLLQETLQAEKLGMPRYKVIKTEGLPHERTFFVEAVWERGKVKAKGNSIKAAEMAAAKLALKKLENKKSKN